MEKIAIIGTGIAGMGCAHFLHRNYDITMFEKNEYIGGHTNTVMVNEEGKQIPIDTGFMVFNHVTYPNLLRLFGELQVPTKKTSMSFSVQHLPTGLEYAGTSLNHLFAQRRNLFSPHFILMLKQIDRFNKESLEVLENPRYDSYTLEQYIEEKNFGREMLEKYLVPMSSAVWSTPPDLMVRFPAKALIRFFQNHGFLGLNTQHQWYTIDGGSQVYREKLIAPFREKIHVKTPVVNVHRIERKTEIVTADGSRALFDKVILASHADESLAMLDQPTELEQKLLSAFSYQVNSATLHTDTSVMPKKKLAWSSWNYRIRPNSGTQPITSTVYWMNSLQNMSKRRNYFLNINDREAVRKDTVLWEMDYTHPVFSLEASRAQKDLPKLNEHGPIYFCGSYFRYGFHEDAFTSAVELCKTITGTRTWE
jgi:predicted NAD/FAD-binding protein